MLAGFLVFSSIMEVVEGSVAFLTCYHALKFYRLTGEKLLLRIHLAFLILGIGLLTHGTAIGITLSLIPSFLVFRTSALILFACELIAYVMLAYSYAKAGKEALAPVAPLLLLAREGGRKLGPEGLIRLIRYHPLLEALILVVLIYLSYKTISNFMSRGGLNPLLVSFSFLFLTVAHVCFLLSYSLAALYITAHVIQLLAFLSMLLMMLRVIST